MADNHPLTEDAIEKMWPGADPAVVRGQFDALMALCQRKAIIFPKYPEHMAQIVVEKSRDFPDRLNELKAALDAVPDHLRRYVWKADKKQSFGDKYVRLHGDDGHGFGRQYLAAVPATPQGYFGGLADFMAAANPDTIGMLLAELSRLQAENAELRGELP